MKIVFFGTPSFVIPVLESLHAHFEIVAVVTTPDVVVGKKKILTPTPVAQFAMSHNIPVLKPEVLDIGHWTLEIPAADLLIVAAYGKLIPQTILDLPTHGSLNIHPSLLPKYRGPSPIQTAILQGDKETGVTIMQMDQELDHGAIVKQESISLDGTENFSSLHTKLFRIAADMLPETIEQYSNKTITPILQDESKAIYCKKITKQDGFFDIQNPPAKDLLGRMIRAFYPWPTAWTRWQIANGKSQVVKFLPDRKIQLEGGKAMSIKDFLNGYPALRETINSLL